MYFIFVPDQIYVCFIECAPPTLVSNISSYGTVLNSEVFYMILLIVLNDWLTTQQYAQESNNEILTIQL